ncbi:Zn-dependent protease with chaperone function [Marmoricola sp. OAE513]|uniref:M48 family metalloprotease n=1 Tax=Marmoricola sp. OAE513 TaxID=2817894 RepID=UPI001AE8499C
MKYTLRALLAVGLLVGFYVVAVGLAVALVAVVVEAVALGANGAVVAKLVAVAAVAGFAIFKGLFSRTKENDGEPDGTAVTEVEQPVLWAEVRSLADQVGTRVPDEIRLVAQVNAAVAEDSSFLGLVPGTRRLYVGVPLLLGLDRGQLRSVLAHELGHYSGKHTALGPITYRGKEAIARVLRELGPTTVLGRLLGLYAKLYYAASHSTSRRQELEADEYSLRIAGRPAATSALRQVAALGVAWDYFVTTYVAFGEEDSQRPDDLFIGFAALIADPASAELMEQVRGDLPEPETSVYDTHPPLRHRIAVMEAADVPPVAPDTAPGLDLLVDARRTLASFEEQLFAGTGRRPARWEDLAEREGVREVVHASAFLASRPDLAGEPPTLGAALANLAAGVPLGLGDGATKEQESTLAARILGDATADHLVRAGAATFRLSWSGGGWKLTAEDGTSLDPWSAARTVAESDDVTPFRAWAVAHGVDLDAVLDVPDDAPLSVVESPALDGTLGVIAPVSHRGTRALVATGVGLLLPKVGWVQQLTWGFKANYGRSTDAMARRFERTPLATLAADPRTIAYAWSDVAAVHVATRRIGSSKVRLRLTDGAEVVLKVGGYSGSVGEPWLAVSYYLGPRYTVD